VIVRNYIFIYLIRPTLQWFIAIKMVSPLRGLKLDYAELSFSGNESSQERKVPGTKVPGTFVLGERKFSIGTFCSWERKVLCTKSL